MARTTSIGISNSTPRAVGRYNDSLTVGWLSRRDLEPFRLLIARSKLPSFADPDKADELLDAAMWLGCRVSRRLIGCCGIKLNVMKAYHGRGELQYFPQPNVYFFGAYVSPECRGQGVGTVLYEERLSYARHKLGGPIIVELMGRGRPYSVDPGTITGYKFYRRRGFEVIGYSIDPDAGPVLYSSRGARLR